MASIKIPIRKGLLVGAGQVEDLGLKDGVSLLTLDMPMYDNVYNRCVADYLQHGRPMPYANADSVRVTRNSSHGPAMRDHGPKTPSPRSVTQRLLVPDPAGPRR